MRCGCIGDDAGEEKVDNDGEEKDDDFQIFVRRERESAGSAESSASPSSVPSPVPPSDGIWPMLLDVADA